jgi:hypothetical protein
LKWLSLASCATTVKISAGAGCELLVGNQCSLKADAFDRLSELILFSSGGGDVKGKEIPLILQILDQVDLVVVVADMELTYCSQLLFCFCSFIQQALASRHILY